MRRHVLQTVGGHHAHVAGAADPVVDRVPAVLQVDELGAAAAGQDVLRRGLVPVAAVMVVGFEDRPQRHLLSSTRRCAGRSRWPTWDRPPGRASRPPRWCRLPDRRSTSRPDRRSRTRLSIRTTGGRCTSWAGSTAAGRCPRRTRPACRAGMDDHAVAHDHRSDPEVPARADAARGVVGLVLRERGPPPLGARAGVQPHDFRPVDQGHRRPSVAMFRDGSKSTGSPPPFISFHLM